MNKRLEKLREEAERVRYDAQDRGLVTATGDLAELVRDLIDILLEDEDRYESTRGGEEPRR